MTYYQLLYGGAHGRVVKATPDRDDVVFRCGIWIYLPTGAVTDDGLLVAEAMQN